MRAVKDEPKFDEFAAATASGEDRRTQDRLTLMKTLVISHFDSGLALETTTVSDISREGIYFISRSAEYQIGMKLTLTIPSLGFEGACEVVRIEKLPTGCLGIAGAMLGG